MRNGETGKERGKQGQHIFSHQGRKNNSRGEWFFEVIVDESEGWDKQEQSMISCVHNSCSLRNLYEFSWVHLNAMWALEFWVQRTTIIKNAAPIEPGLFQEQGM